MTDLITNETCMNVTKGAAALNHLKQNRIEYLVILVFSHMLGLTDLVLSRASGVCGLWSHGRPWGRCKLHTVRHIDNNRPQRHLLWLLGTEWYPRLWIGIGKKKLEQRIRRINSRYERVMPAIQPCVICAYTYCGHFRWNKCHDMSVRMTLKSNICQAWTTVDQEQM